MRALPTPAEAKLWTVLRAGHTGFPFRQQEVLEGFIVDFCCLAERLIVEVDGIAHDMGDRPQRDDTRAQFLKENGFRVLRISAQRVLADAVGTAEAIVARAANPHHQPSAGPPPRAGEAI